MPQVLEKKALSYTADFHFHPHHSYCDVSRDIADNIHSNFSHPNVSYLHSSADKTSLRVNIHEKNCAQNQKYQRTKFYQKGYCAN